MAPINSLPGFSLPRMLIEYIESGEDQNKRQIKLIDGLKIIKEEIQESKTSAELMARVAERFVKDGTNIDKIIKQILSQGWVDEHNAKTSIEEAINVLEKYALTIWKYYKELTPEKRKAKGLVV